MKWVLKMYSKDQVDQRIQAIKERYSNFETVSILRYNGSGLYLSANEADGSQFHFRLTTDGKLFVHKNGKWQHVKNFLFRESN